MVVRAGVAGLIILIPGALDGAELSAQGAPLDIPAIEGSVDLDGRLSEVLWRSLPSLPLTMLQPVAGGPPSDSAEVRLGHDGRFLYVGFRFFVRDPATIRSGSLTRDRLGASDRFELLLDSFNDNQNAVGFATTPSGNQVDYSVGGDGASIDFGWNTFWDAATSRGETSWSGEVRIPFASLRFQSAGGAVTMGLTVARYTAGTGELATFPAFGSDLANPLARPSAARKLTLRGVRGSRPVYITPYVLAGYQREAVDPGTTGQFRTRDSSTAQVGGDLKVNLTDNLTLDLTANTDFAQVEADDQQINLTRFSLFFPEKRLFFLERAGTFSLPLGDINDPSQLFHSRRIGLGAEGRPLRIYGGGRLVGRVGRWDLGVLDLAARQVDGTGSENHAVFRLRRELINPQSAVGVMLTSRTGDPANRNLSYAVDARIRTLSRDYLTLAAGGSDQPGPATRQAGFGRGFARIAYQRLSSLQTSGLGYQAGAKWSGPDFRPGLGFDPRSDYTHLYANVRYGVLLPSGSLRLVQPSLTATRFLSNADGERDSGFEAFYLNLLFRSGMNGWVGYLSEEQLLRADLPLSPTATVPAGRYRFGQVEAALFSSDVSRLNWSVTGFAGRLYDGRVVKLTVAPSYTVSEHLTVGAEYEATRLRFGERGEAFDPDVLRLRLTAAADRRLSGTAFVQYNAAARLVIPNLRLRYRFAEGRDLHLVYNERLNTDRDRLGPSVAPLPLSQERAFILKYSHTFIR
jgi:hypothetical protein